MNEEDCCHLNSFLQSNIDIFAWTASDMLTIDPGVIIHHLNVDPNHHPIRQKKKKFTSERQKVIEEEMDKLMKAGFMQEVNYPEWLATSCWLKRQIKNGEHVSTTLT